MQLRRNVSLSKYCTMQVGGRANYFAEPQNEEELKEALEFITKENLSLFILGKGSNVLFSDEGFKGLVLSLSQFDQEKLKIDLKNQTLSASGGMHLSRLVLEARDAGLGGAEFLCNVPGTLGGALVMNAGFTRDSAKKKEIASITESVTVMTLQGEKQTKLKDELCFSYRKSNLESCIVLEGTLKLIPSDKKSIQDEIRANFDYRNKRQDLGHPSSGSIFKNPSAPHPAAAQLIEQIGWKGKKCGGAMISDRHSNYIVNAHSATCSDVEALITQTQQAVFEKTGIQLETEVRIIKNN